MSRLLTNLTVFALCAILSLSCELINLLPIDVSIEPVNNAVLPDLFSPVIIKFDTEMEKRNAESLLQISSDFGSINGEKRWEKNNLYFVPIHGWTAGIRYNLNFKGTIRAADGREARIENYISFYAINKNDPPVLESHSPVSGESIKTNNVVFKFNFSKSMNRLSVESALTIEGIGNKTYEWLDDDKTIIVTPDKSLSPWNFFRWNLKDSAKSIDGIPLVKAYSGNFITDMDQILPEVTSVYPAEFSGGCWYPAAVNMETGLIAGQGIAVSFNKPMSENVLRSLRFEPSASGRAEMLTEKSIVYIFSKDPEPEIDYTLIVSSDAKDTEGLKIGVDYKTIFKVNIPYLRVISFSVNYGDTTINFTDSNNVVPVIPDTATGEVNISIRFSLPFTDNKRKQSVPQEIIITPFFPRTISSVNLLYASWSFNEDLNMRWKGFSAGNSLGVNNEVPHYYKLLIPGGNSGISCGNGSYMKEDFIIYLEAVK
ncbi:MAG: Ig-like domain-containing protein [Treponema sp.]|nr:Ig-like domain-containing protein [Treponema sp.]